MEEWCGQRNFLKSVLDRLEYGVVKSEEDWKKVAVGDDRGFLVKKEGMTSRNVLEEVVTGYHGRWDVGGEGRLKVDTKVVNPNES